MSRIIDIPPVAAGTWLNGVAAEADLPASGNSLYDTRVSLSDETIFIWTGAAWVGISGGGGGGGVTTVGAFSGSAQTNGASISSTTITFGPASNTVPGMVGTGAQTWAGVKTFSSQPIFSSLTASLPVLTDGSKGLVSVSYATLLSSLGAAPTASPTFTGTVTLPSGTALVSPALSGTTTGFDIGISANGGDGRTIKVGSATIRTGDGNTNQLGVYLANGASTYLYENGAQIYTMSAQSANFGAFEQGRDWTMQWGMGKGTSHYGKGRVRGYGSSTAVGNTADASEDDLISKTVQANELPNNDEDLTILSWGTVSGAAGTKTIKLYVGAVAICTISSILLSKTWSIRAVVTRTGSSAQKYVCESNIDGTVAITSGTLSFNTASTVVIKTTGQSSSSTADDVLNEALRVDYDRAGN